MAEVPAAPAEELKPAPAPDEPAKPEGEKPAEPKAERPPLPADEVDRIIAKAKKNARYEERKRLEAYYRGLNDAKTAAPQEPQKPAEDPAPKREAYESYEEFLTAKASFEAKKAVRAERETQDKETAQRTEAQKQDALMNDFRRKTKEKFPDIEEKLEEIGEMTLPPGAGMAVAESEFGSEILNHWADNPQDLEKLSKLSPSAAIREIGKLEARFESEAKKPEPKQERKPSAAPEPIEPVGGKSSVESADPSAKDDIDTWWKKREAQIMRQRKAQSRRAAN